MDPTTKNFALWFAVTTPVNIGAMEIVKLLPHSYIVTVKCATCNKRNSVVCINNDPIADTRKVLGKCDSNFCKERPARKVQAVTRRGSACLVCSHPQILDGPLAVRFVAEGGVNVVHVRPQGPWEVNGMVVELEKGGFTATVNGKPIKIQIHLEVLGA